MRFLQALLTTYVFLRIEALHIDDENHSYACIMLSYVMKTAFSGRYTRITRICAENRNKACIHGLHHDAYHDMMDR
jgi:hypothetical protein